MIVQRVVFIVILLSLTFAPFYAQVVHSDNPDSSNASRENPGNTDPSNEQDNSVLPTSFKQDTQFRVSQKNLLNELPLYFIPNEGQVDEHAAFYARTSQYILWITGEGLVFETFKCQSSPPSNGSEKVLRTGMPGSNNGGCADKVQRDFSRLLFLAGNNECEILPADGSEYKVHYYLSRDQTGWRTSGV